MVAWARRWINDSRAAQRERSAGLSTLGILLLLAAIGIVFAAALAPFWWRISGFVVASVFLIGGFADVHLREVRAYRRRRSDDAGP